MPDWYWIVYAVVIAALSAFAGWNIANSLSAATSHLKGSGGRPIAWGPFAAIGLVVALLIASFVL